MTTLSLILAGAVVVQAALILRVRIARTYPEAFVLAVSLVLASLQVLSEILAHFSRFRSQELGGMWVIAAIGLGCGVFLLRRNLRLPTRVVGRFENCTYCVVVIIVILTLVTGLLVAPNNWDSLSYHLPRAAHWLQQGSLEFFQTSNARQNVMPPLPSIIHAQFLTVEGGEHLAFLGQWLAGIAVLVAVAIVASELGGDRRAVCLSVLFAASVPMFLAQMSTTQSDLLAGLPAALGVVALRWLVQGAVAKGCWFLGLASGLAVAIKPTAVIFLMPLLLGAAWVLLRRKHVAQLALLGIATAIGIVVLNASYFLRLITAGDLVPESASDVINARVGLDVTIMNVVRSLALLISLPSERVTARFESLLALGSESLGWNLSDPGSTFGPEFLLPNVWSEDHAGAPLQMVLVAGLLVAALLSRKRCQFKRAFVFSLFVLGLFIVFASVFRWQVWGNRFYFLFPVFLAPVAGVILARMRNWSQILLSTVLAASALIWVLVQPLRGIAGSEWIPDPVRDLASIPSYASPLGHNSLQQMLAYNPASARTYTEAMAYAASLSPTQLELEFDDDWWEFPIWVLNQRELKVPIVHRTVQVTGSQGERSAEAHSQRTGDIVRICLGECATQGLKGARSFRPPVTPEAPVSKGPTLVVGKVAGN